MDDHLPWITTLIDVLFLPGGMEHLDGHDLDFPASPAIGGLDFRGLTHFRGDTQVFADGHLCLLGGHMLSIEIDDPLGHSLFLNPPVLKPHYRVAPAAHHAQLVAHQNDGFATTMKGSQLIVTLLKESFVANRQNLIDEQKVVPWIC
jgi:hypothetical protein